MTQNDEKELNKLLDKYEVDDEFRCINLYAAIDEYTKQQVKLFAIPDVRLSLQHKYENEHTEHPQYEDDGKIDGDTGNEA